MTVTSGGGEVRLDSEAGKKVLHKVSGVQMGGKHTSTRRNRCFDDYNYKLTWDSLANRQAAELVLLIALL